MRPNAWTFLTRGWQQIRAHGVRLLWLRYIRRRAILNTAPVPCPESAGLEVHTQVCARDWLNAVWTFKSFRRFAGAPFHLVLLCDRTVTPEAIETLRAHFPGARILPCQEPGPEVREAFATAHPGLFALRTNGSYFTLPKIMDSFALRRQPIVLTIDPDVLFFEQPAELLANLDPQRSFFARFNLPRRDADPRGAFCIDPAPLREQFGFELPLRFNCGLGSLNYAATDWSLIERILAAIPPDPARAFMLDQTIMALFSLARGWEALPTERYVLEPVDDLTGVVARHYFGKTRDLMYLEGLPRLIKLGLLQKDFRSPSPTAISAG